MNIVFDPVKSVGNQIKHGISLAAAQNLEWDCAMAALDDRRPYGEDRMIAIGYIGDRLYVVVYVDRDDCRRVISLRKANAREVKQYAEA
ncbi:phage protein [Bordetella ansorpii]|uniref:Phage protein n=1 Tax=Bordetella ansorpii TaxID=288768 RepID=A0A157S619_9BORD|nr:BrnT family toxin [Bordetella ansorpii]SAI65852.1 phage protein [Bordetella ansorpii]